MSKAIIAALPKAVAALQNSLIEALTAFDGLLVTIAVTVPIEGVPYKFSLGVSDPTEDEDGEEV
jgi:hypothetical protein